ncbi:MAG TPA: family 16 glycoside hydrolase [Ktedonosporobacter sp.]|nr:family 16 glycoside hydrolase [Ktedonosporobacter sp.]
MLTFISALIVMLSSLVTISAYIAKLVQYVDSSSHTPAEKWKYTRRTVAIILVVFVLFASIGGYLWFAWSGQRGAQAPMSQATASPAQSQVTSVPAHSQATASPQTGGGQATPNPTHPVQSISSPTGSQVAASTVPTGPTPAYQANWSTDSDNWSLPNAWQWQNSEGGILVTGGTVFNGLVMAPYQLSTQNYAVEVQMKRLAYTSTLANAGRAYGVVVANTSNGGYVCGVGSHGNTPEHYFVGNMKVVNSIATFGPDLGDANTPFDTNWHIYRVEVKGGTITYFFDGSQVLQANVTRSQAGQVGLYADSTQIAVKQFKIFPL